MILVSSLHY